MDIAPKSNFINSTRELINKSETSEEVVIGGVRIITDPEVFNPAVFFSSEWFADHVSSLVKGEKVLIEVGCGTGIVSIRSAKDNADLVVHATDINEKAAEQTNINSKLNGVESRVFAYSGDVLDSIPNDVKADSIFWAMPFGYLEPEDELAGRDNQVFDPGYRAIRKFFAEARNHLNESGRLLVGFSVDIGHFELLENIAKENGFTLTTLVDTKGMEKESVSMEIYEARLIR